MPVHWTVSHPQRLVVAVTKDKVTVADIEQYFAGVTADGAMAYRKIFEITHTPMALSEENLKALGQRVVFYAQHGQIGPVAIVAASDESFAQAQIFAAASPPRRPLAMRCHDGQQFVGPDNGLLWPAIERCGGTLQGYYLPTKLAGPTNIGLALIDFPSLAAYEQYRAALLTDAAGAACLGRAERAGCILVEDRSFLCRVTAAE